MPSDSFEYEFLFRPQIVGRSRQGDGYGRARSRPSALGRIRRAVERASRAGGGTKKARYDIGETPASSRRCVVKSHYVATRGGGRLAAARHLGYLERDGVERDGSPGRLYNAGGPVDRAAFAEPLDGEKRQFRFVVSPEDARAVDLSGFALQLVAQMERDLGRPLVWAAVNHHDTEHPHVHLVVRGVDGNGKEVHIPQRYIKRDMRARAQQLLTRELGLRSAHDIGIQRRREVDQERLTSLDWNIQRLVGVEGRLEAKALATLAGPLRASVLARLAVLARLGLAMRRPHGVWELAAGWQQDLTQLGLRNDVVKRLHRVAPGDPSRFQQLDPAGISSPIEGVVRGRGLHDELTGEMFAAVETAAGETHYVRLERQAAEFLSDGDVVRISRVTESWIKPTDQVLARTAERTGGLYLPERHLQELQTGGATTASPQDLVNGNVRRLERLERYGLVERLPDGSWRVPADLLEQLRAREATHPRHRLLVQYSGANLGIQATYPGPTWLDRQVPGTPGRAAAGFGAELEAAIRRRAAHLVSMGLSPRPGEDGRRLDAMERLLLGRRLAGELGVTYDDRGTNARGTLVNCPPLPSGRQFARVVDPRTKRLLLVPASLQTARLEGREVEVTVDQNKRVDVRPARSLNRGGES
ncbi:MAG TPA: DUF3363 domain-containing protein [Polyangia bacterium]|nr:DUF3363 domain-containing protein [Polyangia bacterium]